MHGTTQLMRLEYIYDDRGLVTNIDEYEGGSKVADVDFTYDSRGRLRSEVRNHTGDPSRSYDLAYEYDQAGNRTKKTKKVDLLSDLVTTYHYDYEDSNWQSDYNQLMWSETCQTSGGMFGRMGPMGPGGGGGGGPCLPVSRTYYYYYNDEGNVVNVFTQNLAPSGGEKPYSTTVLSYAKNNRTVTFAIGEEWTDETDYEVVWGREYRYDEPRARYLRSVLDPAALNNGEYSGEEIWSQYDGDEIYSDYTLDMGDITVTTWYEPGIGMVEDASGTPVVKYYHDNLIGTTRFMTDASGTKIESAVYTAFGERVDGDSRRFGYAGAYGYQTDAAGEMPFLHVGHRYYDPSIGRFLQRDPIGIAGGMNAYEYVSSGPTTRVDPTGTLYETQDQRNLNAFL
jgi:RHS repeat-associated protein